MNYLLSYTVGNQLYIQTTADTTQLLIGEANCSKRPISSFIYLSKTTFLRLKKSLQPATARNTHIVKQQYNT